MTVAEPNPNASTAPATPAEAPGLAERAQGVAEGVANEAQALAADAAEAAAPAAEAAVATADNAGNWAQRQGAALSDWWSGFTEDMDGWGMAGTIGLGVIMWVIGNAFGGGGILGLIISTMLMGFVVANNGQIGKDFGDALQSMFGGSDSPQQDASQQPQQQPELQSPAQPQSQPGVAGPVQTPVPVSAELDPASRLAAQEAVSLADFSTSEMPGTLTSPPRIIQAVAR